ncbi:hypothetical protein Z043_120761 [Scleropages formosus]|uniref:UBC core domain-containing protein n=1 Tax=Scleropages formosus TaxID=113540 RepID=A0A0P7UNF5_SCLFO|nr:hypothetical protein Z043_120761 [Scleropages formosus]
MAAQRGHAQVASSQKALMLEMKSLQEEPVEGFRITLVEEADLYNWEVAIFGPPNTLYEGGYFKVGIFSRSCWRRRPKRVVVRSAPIPPQGPVFFLHAALCAH